ncbi:substrate-binding domain-containing protein [Streptomyces sp. 3MP-14]|uniref:Substrate-binding domain-containing protein n=1 Tax=Streptomyces mimosae TaxID=2586635 RepID=A0A5N6AKK9_9ACTN|nr:MULTISPECIES: LacI family DNA-binding transcriptional regulator [Streptomyces]KAB8168652.1 substrate-binding domain-containing protein [Streptomyces mimosae]KAB8178068.1 substrate-binding domain-containing protein [Streptomyces sp. 3MP-14]
MTTDPAPRSRPVTLEHVARAAGVSRATVSRVINGEATVDPRLRKLVEEAIARTSYVPNRAARSLVTRRTDSVALVVSEQERRDVTGPFVGRIFTDPYFGRVLTGLLEVLRPRGIQVMLTLADDEASRAQLLGYLQQGHVDGVVLISSHAQDPLPGLLSRTALPAVLAARPAAPTPLTYVDVDQRAGALLAAERLLAEGRRRIATIAGPQDMPLAQERLSGFRAALAERGHADVPWTEGDFTQASGGAAMKWLLAEHPDVDGVFVANDLMALGAVTTLHRAGRRVPEDVAVVGFDDSVSALACDPPLTTVRQPVEEMAAEMARLLLRQIESRERPLPSVVFHPSLVVRQSG